jgi:hypothetical protein
MSGQRRTPRRRLAPLDSAVASRPYRQMTGGGLHGTDREQEAFRMRYTLGVRIHLSGAVVECPKLSSGFAYVYQTPDLGALREEWQERPMVARG